MAVFMFWNTKGRPLYDQIGTICQDYDVDIAIFAEPKLATIPLLEALNPTGPRYFSELPSIGSRIQFFTRYPLEWIEPRYDGPHASIRLLKHPLGGELLIVAVHLPSKLHQKDEDQEFHIRNLSDAIAEQESHIGHHRTLVMGDFNMDPFENGMIVADGLHAVMDKNIASIVTRRVGGKSYRIFYNPMWSRLGDDSVGPCGTYYYNNSSASNYFWHTFDQILIRSDLLQNFDHSGLHVVTHVADQEFLTSGRIDERFSDHLPIVLRLNIERGA